MMKHLLSSVALVLAVAALGLGVSSVLSHPHASACEHHDAAECHSDPPTLPPTHPDPVDPVDPAPPLPEDPSALALLVDPPADRVRTEEDDGETLYFFEYDREIPADVEAGDTLFRIARLCPIGLSYYAVGPDAVNDLNEFPIVARGGSDNTGDFLWVDDVDPVEPRGITYISICSARGGS